MSYTNHSEVLLETDSPCCVAVSQLLLCLVFLLAIGRSFAQVTAELEIDVEAAQAYLIKLDALASKCLDLEPASEICASFSDAVSPAQLSNYQMICQPALAWREQLVTQATAATELSTAAAQQTLELLLKTESACGNKALVNRTQFVARAFAHLQAQPTHSLREIEGGRNPTSADYANFRRMLDQSTERSRLRLQQETNRQWRLLELENSLRLQQQLNVDLSNPALP